MKAAAIFAALAATAVLAPPCRAGQGTDFAVIGGNVQERANAVLTLMAFSVAPDITAGSLSINSASTDDPSVTLVQFGSGATLADSFPLYVEGFLGFNRYDPTFVASDGQQQRQIPTKSNIFSRACASWPAIWSARTSWESRSCSAAATRPPRSSMASS